MTVIVIFYYPPLSLIQMVMSKYSVISYFIYIYISFLIEINTLCLVLYLLLKSCLNISGKKNKGYEDEITPNQFCLNNEQ